MPMFISPKACSLSCGLDEFVRVNYKGLLVRKFKMFFDVHTLVSKKRGTNLLCQAYRHVVDVFIHYKKSWGGTFNPENLRVTNTGKFFIDLIASFEPILENFLADLKKNR